jgi:hypothetical protein
LHAVPLGAFVTVHACVAALQPPILQRVVCGAQSPATRQATHFPAPSQTLPPSSEQGAPAVASVVAQQPAAQVSTRQAVAWLGQSATMAQA